MQCTRRIALAPASDKPRLTHMPRGSQFIPACLSVLWSPDFWSPVALALVSLCSWKEYSHSHSHKWASQTGGCHLSDTHVIFMGKVQQRQPRRIPVPQNNQLTQGREKEKRKIKDQQDRVNTPAHHMKLFEIWIFNLQLGTAGHQITWTVSDYWFKDWNPQ